MLNYLRPSIIKFARTNFSDLDNTILILAHTILAIFEIIAQSLW